jgi:hypothetical protein
MRRQREVLGGGAVDGRGPQVGKAAAVPTAARTARVGGGGEDGLPRLAGPHAWLGRKERGRGEKGKRFSLF